MRIDFTHWKLGSAVLVALLALVVTTGGTMASDVCAPDADGCIIVNSNLDNNVRDDALTLHEALLLASGELNTARLTAAESGQVAGYAYGVDGDIAIHFDTDVFCDGCESSVITLVPPGLGGPATYSPPGLGGPAYTGDMVFALPPGLGGPACSPPGLGGPACSPPGLGGPARIGMGLHDGEEVPAPVVIDGSLLPAEYVGLWSFGASWLRGIHFQGFAGHAVEVEAGAVAELLIGSNGDGVNDLAEAVTFSGNGGDVVVVGE
jgi:hypothetical protein